MGSSGAYKEQAPSAAIAIHPRQFLFLMALVHEYFLQGDREVALLLFSFFTPFNTMP